MKIRKIGNKIALLLMGCLILFHLLTAFLSITGLSRKGGLLPLTLLTVETGSMEPDMSAGDLLIDWEFPYEELQVGDDITFQRNDEFITHRILRKEGSRLVTKGLANNAEDESIGPQDYCAKVILVIPYLGRVLDFLENPICLLCVLLAVAALFYAPQFADWVTEHSELRKNAAGAGEFVETAEKKTSAAFSWGSPVKVLAMLTVMSFLLATPLMTQAKYVAVIDVRKAAAAGILYMSSNLLSQEGETYVYSGWSGGAKGLTLNINNYDNELMYNPAGTDLLYGVRIVKVTEGTNNGTAETYRTDYTVKINSEPDAADDTMAAHFTWPTGLGDSTAEDCTAEGGPYLLEGSDTPDSNTGMYGRTHKLDLIVKMDDQTSLKAGDRIRFRIYAATSDSYGYSRQLSADYILIMAGGTDFIEYAGLSTTEGSVLINYNIRTGLVNGSGVRNVKVTWDSDKMYLNEYEATAFTALQLYLRSDGTYDPTQYSRGDGTEGSKGFIILSLPAYANVTLQFFKQEAYLNSGAGAFTVNAAEATNAGTNDENEGN